MSCIKSIYQNYFIEYLKLFMELYSHASYDYEERKNLSEEKKNLGEEKKNLGKEKKNLGKEKKNLNRLRRIP